MIRKKLFGGESLQAAQSMNSIGYVHYIRWENNKALELHLKCLEIRKRLLKEDDVLIGVSYNDAGVAYGEDGNFEKAIEFLEKSIEIYLPYYEKFPHPRLAASYENLGAIYEKQQKYDTALEYYQKGSQLYLGIFGEDNPHYAGSLGNLGMAHYQHKKYEDALQCLKRSLEIRVNHFKGLRPEIATSYNNLGLVYDD